METYPFFEIEKLPDQKTAILYFNRPDKLNAMHWPFWRDLPLVVADLENDPEVLVVIVAGRGRSFTSGIDVVDFFSTHGDALAGTAPESREKLHRLILQMQEGFNRMAFGNTVYIAAVHRHCIGGGLDVCASCDLRLASRDAIFSLRETRIAIVADMGSLNRLPRIIGQGNTRLMALTGRDFSAEEAFRMGLVNALYDTREELLQGAVALAAEIANNAPNAVRGVKRLLNYMETHGSLDGLDYVAVWNSAFLNVQAIQDAVVRSLPKKQ